MKNPGGKSKWVLPLCAGSFTPIHGHLKTLRWRKWVLPLCAGSFTSIRGHMKKPGGKSKWVLPLRAGSLHQMVRENEDFRWMQRVWRKSFLFFFFDFPGVSRQADTNINFLVIQAAICHLVINLSVSPPPPPPPPPPPYSIISSPSFSFH